MRIVERWNGIDVRLALRRGRWFLNSNLCGLRAAILANRHGYLPEDVMQLPGDRGTASLKRIVGAVDDEHSLWLLSGQEHHFHHEHRGLGWEREDR